jgi:hypothetical protein
MVKCTAEFALNIDTSSVPEGQRKWLKYPDLELFSTNPQKICIGPSLFNIKGDLVKQGNILVNKIFRDIL